MDRLVDDARAVIASMGLLVAADGDYSAFAVQRFTLLPTRVRASEFRDAQRLTSVLNKLVLALAADVDFLAAALRRTAAADRAFTGRLLDVLRAAAPHQARQRVAFALNRYDFFVDAAARPDAPPAGRGLRIVELNCVASGGVLAARALSELHAAVENHRIAQTLGICRSAEEVPPPGLNKCDARVGESIVRAHHAFERVHGVGGARVVMVVAPLYGVRTEHAQLQWHAARLGVDPLRMTLCELHEHAAVDETTGHLVVRRIGGVDAFTVSVAYFRTGYTPDDYAAEREWDARALLERSTAASCPSVAVQLVRTKKM